MTRSLLRIIPAAVFVATGLAHASITFTGPTSTGSVAQNDVSSNPITIFQQTQTGPPVSINSPLTTNTVGNMIYLTQANLSCAITTNTPTFYQMDTYFAADCETSGSNNNNATGNSRADLDSVCNFTLDSAGTITFTVYNTVLQTTVGSAWASAGASKSLWLDGNLVQSNYLDSTLTFNLGAGAHSFEVDERALASFASGPPPTDYATTYAVSRTRVTIESVPEPITLISLAGGLSLWIRRRRQVA